MCSQVRKEVAFTAWLFCFQNSSQVTSNKDQSNGCCQLARFGDGRVIVTMLASLRGCPKRGLEASETLVIFDDFESP
jgi:hypothetical protein